MLTYQKEGVSLKTVLDTRRELKGGLYRVRIRIFFRRKVLEYSTGKKVTVEDWEKLANPTSRRLQKIHQDILSTFRLIEGYVREMTETGSFSFNELNNRMQRNDSETLNSLLQQKINQLDKEKRLGSKEYYTSTLKAVERYDGKKVFLYSVDVEWLKGFERFLLTEKKSYATIGMYARGIRTVINFARKNGIIKESQYPFGTDKYEIPTGESRKLALTLQQIGKIVNFSDGAETTKLYRDLWFFSYLANGINFNDMLRLKYINIMDGEICWYRQKTINTRRNKKYIQAYLTPEMKDIIKRWGNKPDSDNYIFPFLKNGMTPEREKQVISDIVRRVNRKMKYIGTQTGTGSISTYTARHSFATILKRSGANVSYISESLGHSDIKTTENYLARFEQSERAKNAAFLTNFSSTEDPKSETDMGKPQE